MSIHSTTSHISSKNGIIFNLQSKLRRMCCKLLVGLFAFVVLTGNALASSREQLLSAYQETLQEQFDVFSRPPLQVANTTFLLNENDIILGKPRPKNWGEGKRGWAFLNQLSMLLYIRPGSAETATWKNNIYSGFLDQKVEQNDVRIVVRFFPLTAEEALAATNIECLWKTGNITEFDDLLDLAAQPIKRIEDAVIVQSSTCNNPNHMNDLIKRMLVQVPYCFYMRCERNSIGNHLVFDVKLPILWYGDISYSNSQSAPQFFAVAHHFGIDTTNFSESGKVINKLLSKIGNRYRK